MVFGARDGPQLLALLLLAAAASITAWHDILLAPLGQLQATGPAWHSMVVFRVLRARVFWGRTQRASCAQQAMHWASGMVSAMMLSMASCHSTLCRALRALGQPCESLLDAVNQTPLKVICHAIELAQCLGCSILYCAAHFQHQDSCQALQCCCG